MNLETVIYLGQQTMWITLLVSAPMLISGMVIGLIISVMQSVTQIQEITLSFVPKIIVVMIVTALFMPFMAGQLLTFIQMVLGDFHRFIH